MVLKTLTDLKIVANNFKIMANHSFRNVICNWVYPTWCALLWERIWHKHVSMRVQQVPALQEQKWMLPCWQTGRLCQRSQTKAIWSTAACPSTNHTARGDGYSVTTVQFTQSTTDTSLQLLIRKGFCFTNIYSQGYVRDLRHLSDSYIWVTAQRTLPIQPQCFVLPKLTSVTYIRIHIHWMLLWQWYSSHGLS